MSGWENEFMSSNESLREDPLSPDGASLNEKVDLLRKRVYSPELPKEHKSFNAGEYHDAYELNPYRPTDFDL